MRKAKNAPPWTKKKLHRYRTAQRTLAAKQAEESKRQMEQYAESAAGIDKAMKGCGLGG